MWVLLKLRTLILNAQFSRLSKNERLFGRKTLYFEESFFEKIFFKFENLTNLFFFLN